MKRGKTFFLLGFLFLTSIASSFANVSLKVNNCDLPAPQNLHITARGTSWVSIAWNPVPSASSYQVTTRNQNTGVILSNFSIDQPYATITNLPGNVPLLITVAALHPDCTVPSAGTSITMPPLGLVFDLVLIPNSGGAPVIDCYTECTHSAVAPGSPTLPQFTCPVEVIRDEVGEVISYVPFWLEIEKPVQEGKARPGTTTNLYLFIYPVVNAQGNYSYVEQHNLLPSSQWSLAVDPVNSQLLHIDGSPVYQADVCNFNLDVSHGVMQIFLASGYTLRKKVDCPSVYWVTGGGGLAAQQTIPTTQETLIPINSTTADNLGTMATLEKPSSAFRVVNPVKNELVLYFEQPTGQASILELYSMNGTLAARQQLPEGVSTFSMPAKDLIPGTYLLRVHQETGVETRLVVKQQ